MWNRVISAVLVVAFGLISPVSVTHERTGSPHKTGTGHSAAPSKDFALLALESFALPQASFKTILVKDAVLVAAFNIVWRYEQRLSRFPGLHAAHTLQSQHALLRI